MASLTQWTWIWINSRSWWWTGRPGVLWFMGSQRVRHAWATELTDWVSISVLMIGLFIFSLTSWFSLQRLYILRICLFLLSCPINWNTVPGSRLLRFLHFCGVGCNFFFISTFLDFSHLSFSWWVWLKVYQFCLSLQRISFNFVDLWYCLSLFNLFLLSSLWFLSFY